jgi:5-carboxymethyl-2-hydroxymuconate isomerase
MRLVSFTHQGRTSWGIVDGDGVIDLSRRLPEFPHLLDVLRADALGRLAAVNAKPDLSLSDVTLLPPVTGGEKILCVGVNYANRNEEYRDGSELPKYPSLFYRAPDSLVGHHTPLVRPRVSEQLDYEGEVVLAIGRRSKNVPRERALDHVAGLSIANEGTIRDWVRHGKFNATQGKNFDRSGSLGPWMMTRDALDLTAPRKLKTRVNGETRQDDTTANMIFAGCHRLHHRHDPEARRPDPHRHADRRRRALRSAEMAQARRRGGSRGRRNRDAEERHH